MAATLCMEGGRGEGGGAVMAAGARVVARAVVEKVV